MCSAEQHPQPSIVLARAHLNARCRDKTNEREKRDEKKEREEREGEREKETVTADGFGLCRFLPYQHALCPLFLTVNLLLYYTTELPLRGGPTSTYCLALVKPNRVKASLRQGASSGDLRGCLWRSPLTSQGGPVSPETVHQHLCSEPVYWYLMQPVHRSSYQDPALRYTSTWYSIRANIRPAQQYSDFVKCLFAGSLKKQIHYKQPFHFSFFLLLFFFRRKKAHFLLNAANLLRSPKYCCTAVYTYAYTLVIRTRYEYVSYTCVPAARVAQILIYQL